MTCIDSFPTVCDASCQGLDSKHFDWTYDKDMVRCSRLHIEETYVWNTGSDEMEHTGLKCSPERQCALRFAGSQIYLIRETNED
jgi:hypothetical protein